jgi:hypothetical protein
MPPRRRKKVAPQTLIGEGGVSIIARRVNEMGFLYHDRAGGPRDRWGDRTRRSQR